MKNKAKKVKLESTFEIEKKLLANGYDFVVGIDEAGRGPLAGPVVASAVAVRDFQSIYDENTPSVLRTSPPQRGGEENGRKFLCEGGEERAMWNLVKDSKKLSEKRREEVFEFIQKNFYVGVGICNHETIDRVNILEATFLAMKKAVGDLKSQLDAAGHKESKIIILVDGDKAIPNFSPEQKAIIGGDKIVKSISAASIIAKVTRDRMMLEFDKKYPNYQFAKHKGYGTKIHIEALKLNGACPIHRKSFAPVRNAINDRW